MDGSVQPRRTAPKRLPCDATDGSQDDGQGDTPDPTPLDLEAASLIAAVRRDVDYAFQPIVSLQTGACFGYEALLRGHARLGLPDIGALFDRAWQFGNLHTLDLVLRRKAMEAFARLPRRDDTRLFFNLDNRVLTSPDYRPDQTHALLDEFGFPPSVFCFELSELHGLDTVRLSQSVLSRYRAQSMLLAIDDFGVGFSGLSSLYANQPDIVKIDRMFIADIHGDRKKRVLVASIVNLAHMLGITVVAEGIETAEELLACRSVGCDLGQGFFIAWPTTDYSQLSADHPAVSRLGRQERREVGKSDHSLIREELSEIPPVHIGDEMADVFNMFRRHPACSFFPVLDIDGRPIGIIHEEALKSFIYAEYGRDLLRNRSLGRRLHDFVSECPIADLRSDVEEVLSIYAIDENPAGVLMVEDRVYVGMLSASSLLRVIHEKTLARASDQNPLTKLPGNLGISDFLAGAIDNQSEAYVFAYFDLDNFKPYNDHYGFRQGDRVIQLFAKLLSQGFAPLAAFIGHIGGDDFFVGVTGQGPDTVRERATSVLASFRRDVESFYDAEARAAGGIVGRDRSDRTRSFPLMTASAGLLACGTGARSVTVDALTSRLSRLKRTAKTVPDHVAVEDCICGSSCAA